MKTVVLKFVVCGGQVVLSPPLLRATAVSLNSLIVYVQQIKVNTEVHMVYIHHSSSTCEPRA